MFQLVLPPRSCAEGYQLVTCLKTTNILHSYCIENLQSRFMKVEHFTLLSWRSALEFVSSRHCDGSLYRTVLLSESFFLFSL